MVMRKHEVPIVLVRLALALGGLLVLWESVMRFPRLFIAVWIVSVLVLWWMTARAMRVLLLEKIALFRSILLTLFMTGCAVFIFLQESFWMRQITLALALVGMGTYVVSLYKQAHFPLRGDTESVERLTWYGYVLTIFFWCTDLIALGVLVQFPLWLQLAIFLAVAGFLTAHAYLLDGRDMRDPRVMLFFLCLVLFWGESFWTIHFSPLTFLVVGLLLTYIWYGTTLATLYMLRYHVFDLRAFLNGRKRLVLAIIIAVLLTAQWS